MSMIFPEQIQIWRFPKIRLLPNHPVSSVFSPCKPSFFGVSRFMEIHNFSYIFGYPIHFHNMSIICPWYFPTLKTPLFKGSRKGIPPRLQHREDDALQEEHQDFGALGDLRRHPVARTERGGKIVGKPWENRGKSGKIMENLGKPCENHGTSGRFMGKPWDNGDMTWFLSMKTGDLTWFNDEQLGIWDDLFGKIETRNHGFYRRYATRKEYIYIYYMCVRVCELDFY